MKTNQLALCWAGLVIIQKIVSSTCVYALVLTGDMKGGLICEGGYAFQIIPDTEQLTVL